MVVATTVLASDGGRSRRSSLQPINSTVVGTFPPQSRCLVSLPLGKEPSRRIEHMCVPRARCAEPLRHAIEAAQVDRRPELPELTPEERIKILERNVIDRVELSTDDLPLRLRWVPDS